MMIRVLVAALALLAAPAIAADPWSGKPVWTEEFSDVSALSRIDRGYGPWATSLESRAPFDAKEEQVYLDSATAVTVEAGKLVIRATRVKPLGSVPAGVKEPYRTRLATRAWLSGFVQLRTTVHYGYVEALLKNDGAASSWPAFWMRPARWGAPGEIDLYEGAGSSWVANQTIHLTAGKDQLRCRSVKVIPGTHKYGLHWTPERITFYVDRVPSCSFPTPPELHQPFIPMLNLAVGGWGAPTTAATKPMTMSVDYVRYWAL